MAFRIRFLLACLAGGRVGLKWQETTVMLKPSYECQLSDNFTKNRRLSQWQIDFCCSFLVTVKGT